MSKAYVAPINANSYDVSPSGSQLGVHQTSPSWVLTFVRWDNRDTFRYKDIDGLNVREPLVVVNDCTQLSISMSKSSHTPQLTAVLRAGEINYLTAINPGDFVFANILKFEEHADDVAIRAKNNQPINGIEDGFKGIYKIQSVHQMLETSPDGGKRVVFRITAFGGTELNNTLYFNDQLLLQGASTDLDFMRVSAQFNDLALQKGGNSNIHAILKIVTKAFLGAGVSDTGQKDKLGNEISPNQFFYMPKLVGALLGNPKTKIAADIYNFVFGIQQYTENAASLAAGFFPSNVPRSPQGRFYEAAQQCQGATIALPTYWNQSKAWQVMMQYVNSPINELYFAFKPDPQGRIMPTVILRQMPFSTNQYTNISTKFLSLPRWKLDFDLIFNMSVGKDETARINYVQVFGQSGIVPNTAGLLADQIVKGNYQTNPDDIKRSGLRPYIINTTMDFPESNSKGTQAPTWSKLLSDALFGSENKLSGSVECTGLSYPVVPGDNMEIGDTVFHIETVQYSCMISPNGIKSFKTSLGLSHGIDKNSNSQLIYSKTKNVKQADEKRDDQNSDNILPGITDLQETPFETRNGGELVKETSGTGFGPRTSNPYRENKTKKADTLVPAKAKGSKRNR